MRIAGLAVAAAVALIGPACASGHSARSTSAGTASGTTASATDTTTTSAVAGAGSHPVDLTKLPLGDHKYATSAVKGEVFSCITQFNGGGAFRDGPWIHSDAGTWDATAKIAVSGSVSWDGHLTEAVAGGGEKLSGNGLPTVPTGVFPVAASDPAYQYDRNPNTIKGSTLSVTLPAPKAAAAPTCVGGTIGVSALGVPIFSAFDALGRDAPAHEVQDGCDGHPEMTGQYHYHSLSSCWKDTPGFDPGLFGYALDGFGIYVDRDATGNLLSSADLDECHGRTSEITWHGQKVSMYHYVATPDFPYLVACFRGTPITSATGLRIGRP